MDDTFIGRRRELDLLESAWRGSASAFIPVYGRRRVGKSELILRFLRGKRGLYFLGKQAAAVAQRREFLQQAGAVLDDPLLGRLAAESWKEALEAVTERWRDRHKLVLAIDEFQWIAEASPELPSVLQELWDRRWRLAGNVVLILCGSYIGFMERAVLGRGSPLYGRRTAQILLRPFGYQEAALFHPRLSLVDRAKTYFICGGVPLYLRFFSEHRSVEMNVVANLLDEYAPLHREPEFLLREELREVESYYAVMMALATGAAPSREISRRTGIGDRSLHYYLEQLVQLGYLTRRYPLTGRPPAKRHVRYAIEDPLLRFWFRFVYPNTSYIAQRGGARALADRIRPELEAHYGGCFERLCREALPVLYGREGVTASFEVGEYWDKETQIDVVGLRSDGRADLCECKWGSAFSPSRVAEELRAKAARFPNPRGASIGLRVFTRSALRTRPSGRRAGSPALEPRWHSLAELYED